MYPKGADVLGQVTEARASGRLTILACSRWRSPRSAPAEAAPRCGSSRLRLRVNRTPEAMPPGRRGAALGAVISAIASSGKGAAVGTVVGGGTGSGTRPARAQEEATVEWEALLAFVVAGRWGRRAAGEQTRRASRPVTSSNPDLRGSCGLRDQRLIPHLLSDHASDFPAEGSNQAQRDGRRRPVAAGEILGPGSQGAAAAAGCVRECIPPSCRRLDRVGLRRAGVMLLDAGGAASWMSFDLDRS